MAKTKYVVLYENDESWSIYSDNVEATSTKGAIRVAIKDTVDEWSGRFVAIPRRSWKPQPVTIETRQQLKIG